jgi:methionyl-tRNA formyltransferase
VKLAVLTTETLHHLHFVQAVGRAHEIGLVVVETSIAHASFPTDHPFERDRDACERDCFFNSRPPALADLAQVLNVPRASDPAAIAALHRTAPDVILVFGTGRIRPEVIALAPERIINLHGGDPEHYRGLDTHLWAIYHRQFDQLITTLHHVTDDLDAGDVIGRTPLRIEPGLRLHQLRAVNTRACVELTLNALVELERTGSFPRRPQQAVGRYYSFMPAVLKDICVRNFEHYTGGLAA